MKQLYGSVVIFNIYLKNGKTLTIRNICEIRYNEYEKNWRRIHRGKAFEDFIKIYYGGRVALHKTLFRDRKCLYMRHEAKTIPFDKIDTIEVIHSLRTCSGITINSLMREMKHEEFLEYLHDKALEFKNIIIKEEEVR